MEYSVNITRKAQKALYKIPAENQKKIISNIKSLSTDPFPINSKKLSGRNAWRIRVGVYRVIYEVHNDILTVLVVIIGHRREVYRQI